MRQAVSGEMLYVGHVLDNSQLVNVFTCPTVPVDEIHYVWAGRTDSDRIDGPVRMAEIEAYADELGSLLDNLEGGRDEPRLDFDL